MVKFSDIPIYECFYLKNDSGYKFPKYKANESQYQGYYILWLNTILPETPVIPARWDAERCIYTPVV